MSPAALSRSNTTENDCPHDKTQSPEFHGTLHYPDFKTTALPIAWSPAYDWAVKNNVVSELFLAANATYIRNMPIAIGTLLSFISTEDSYTLIKEWSLYENAAMPLAPLAEAALHDSHIFTEFPPFATERTASRHFHGKLKSHYLIALLTPGLPAIGQVDRTWLNTLRLWTLTHAINRSLLDNTQDSWLREVASKLRMACEHDGDWRKLFLSLRSSATDFDEISRNIIEKIESTRALIKHRPLQAILKVAQRVHAKDDPRPDILEPIPLPTIRNYATNPPIQPIAWQINEDENCDLQNSEWIPADEDTGDSLIQFEIDSEQSFTHQRLKGNSILLYCTEELQYLPLSWSKLNQSEQDQIKHWISENTASTRPELRYMSMVVWIALNLGRTLKRTLDIHITEEIAKDWGLHPETLSFTRSPTRREPGWKPKTAEQMAWITPTSDKQSISAPRSYKKILADRIAASSDPKCIGDLWDAHWTETPEQLFRKEFSTIAPRITGSMLASALPQRVFQNSGDQTFARLLSSHPQTALPGACAYSSWSSDQVSSSLANKAPVLSIGMQKSDNAMGSMLDPIESLLKNSIQSAAKKLEILRLGNDIIAFHNAYSIYLAVQAWAATGGRPVRDPFESLKHFDFQAQFVYISDKAGSSLRQARIVPLPNELCRTIQIDYLNHLTELSRHIARSNPRLAESIASLTSGASGATIPFLFLLSEDAQSWKSITEREVISLGLFDWPLPLNHFRHRLSRQLRKRSVDPELIDAILGHAETGAATHGDFSFRIWIEDMQMARPAMEDAFESLAFPRIPEWSGNLIKLPTSPSNQSCIMGPTEFGAIARENKRRTRAKAVVSDARLQIKQFLELRTISELSESEFDKLSRQLLFSRNGMPHANGHLKYRVLLKCTEREWQNKGKKAKLSKRYQPIPEEKTPFTVAAPGALATFQKVQDQHASIQSINISQIGQHDCAAIAAGLLCIENNISDKALLTDILHARNFRLVVLNNIPYLEYAEKLITKDSDIPTKRFRLSIQAALLLDQLPKKSLVSAKQVPNALTQIAAILAESGRSLPDINAQSLIDALAELADQVNAITKPGILAGYLAGRVRSFSLLWRDWARLELKYPIQIEKIPEPTAPPSTSANIGSFISANAATTPPRNVTPYLLQQDAREFLDEIRKSLDSCQSTSATVTSYKGRKYLAREIQDVIDKYDGQVSTTIQLLARWVNSKLFKKIAGRLIRPSTINRYLAALSPGFKGIGYATDILSMDEEDVTLFYNDLLVTTKAKDTLYIVKRLSDFHRWAKHEYAVEDPDWLELPEAISTTHVSPGLITENEYQRALLLLLNFEDPDRRSRLAAPLLLMLCYRFGLRGSEAFGMLRSDIDISERLTIVYVQNNHFRKLKTQTSRRQVPLLFSLSDEERNLLSQWMAEAESIHGNDHSAALFSDNQTHNGLMDANSIKRRAMAALKIATSNSGINLHHARHSAANFIALALIQSKPSIWAAATPLFQSPQIISTEAILLGRVGQTRRKMWAASRFLGHVRRETTCGNYLHFLSELADLHAKHNENDNTILTLKNAIILDDMPRLAEIDTSLLEQLEPKLSAPTPSQLIKLMRLIACGKPIRDASISLGIAEHVSNDLQSLLDKVGKKIKLANSKLSKKQGDIANNLKLVQRLKEPAWNRLIDFISKIDQQKSPPQDLNLSIDVIIEMIGITRQILLWEESHFLLLKSFIEHMEIDAADCTLARTNQTTEDIDQLIKRHGFDVIPMGNIRKEKAFQMDTAKTGNGKYAVQTRCAFILIENDLRAIRNSVELLVCFIAFTVASK